ncbi:hypothetical protein [Nocardia terpenica]|uniref:hypothetical protein n=1 Tax=Nocardia terpenica TaxID=455432 RepID=UPI002FE3B581
MARKSASRGVFVRAVTSEEGRKLAQIALRSKTLARMRRAIMVMVSAQSQPVPMIAELMQVSEFGSPYAAAQAIAPYKRC